MPGFILDTRVGGTVKEVFSRFNEQLFDYLLPPGWIAEKFCYEGTMVGDKVIMGFKIPFKGIMEVEITEVKPDELHSFFVDEGRILPFGITQWKHIHHVFSKGNCIFIRDEIKFETKSFLISLFLQPSFYFSFLLRKPKYKKYFGPCLK